MNVTVYFPGGKVRKLATDKDRARLGAAVRRASRVEPQSFWLRLLFLSLRRWFGDNGRVAAWTRTWPCRWRARMLLLDRPILGPFKTRQEALEVENAWLITHWVAEDDHG